MIARARLCIADVRDNPLVRATSPFRTWWGRMGVVLLGVGCLGVGMFCAGCFVADVRHGGIGNYRAYFWIASIDFTRWLPMFIGAAVFLSVLAKLHKWMGRLEEIGMTRMSAGEVVLGLLFWPVFIAAVSGLLLILALLLFRITPIVALRSRYDLTLLGLTFQFAMEFIDLFFPIAIGILVGLLVAIFDQVHTAVRLVVFLVLSYLVVDMAWWLTPDFDPAVPSDPAYIGLLTLMGGIGILWLFLALVIPLIVLACFLFQVASINRLRPTVMERHFFRGQRQAWKELPTRVRAQKLRHWKTAQKVSWNWRGMAAISVLLSGFCLFVRNTQQDFWLLLDFSLVLSACFILSIFARQTTFMAGTAKGVWRPELIFVLLLFCTVFYLKFNRSTIAQDGIDLLLTILVSSFAFFFVLSSYLFAAFANTAAKIFLAAVALSIPATYYALQLVVLNLIFLGFDEYLAERFARQISGSIATALFLSGPILLPLCIHYIHRRHFAGANAGDIVRIHRGKSEVLPCPVS
ncbi:MAG: hypothetical protein RLY93_17210 [Sumerlaeia bacterium]